ncbi:heavy-metal-associated domain-containing protein [Rufibacter sp. LB8]|uniref:heavy-metal-associated domain-containing protein n=1 Tax=Rufibacter sp. LB8 TaxID=2777781 RepID=UPI00178C2A8D|nr:heavy metal-associated domain-containing protein [Rufibacter sp. LB8]
MEIIKFKTNISNQSDVTNVAPYLEKIEGISNWQVDTETEENVLSVSGKDLNPQAIENALQEAGFQAEILRVVGLSGDEL